MCLRELIRRRVPPKFFLRKHERREAVDPEKVHDSADEQQGHQHPRATETEGAVLEAYEW